MMTHTTTVELTRGELGLLWTAVEMRANALEEAHAKGLRDGWYDGKEKDRVIVAHDEARRLAYKLNQVMKGMDQ